MKAVIAEDEKLASDNLIKILSDIGSLEVIAVLESVEEVIDWFSSNEKPDILFLDIHLADGSAFSIFEKIQVNCPIIFTTAYDEYALKAFKVNSIDYLLKPLESGEVQKSLEKYQRLKAPSRDTIDLEKISSYLRKNLAARKSFLIPVKGDKLIPLSVDEIMYFYVDSGNIKVVNSEGKSFVMDKTLDEIQEMLDPDLFFRANRQFIISRKAIKDIDYWFNQRFSVNLLTGTPEKIIISKARAREFRIWFTRT